MPPHNDARRYEALLDEARLELSEAAEDLERLNQRLRDHTLEIQRLEVLVDQLLAVLEVPAIVVDADGRITALSRGAADSRADLSDALGKPASSVMPQGIADEALRIVASGSRPANDTSEPPEGVTHHVGDATFVGLPDGSVLVLLSE
jgi:hypothetical protein